MSTWCCRHCSCMPHFSLRVFALGPLDAFSSTGFIIAMTTTPPCATPLNVVHWRWRACSLALGQSWTVPASNAHGTWRAHA